MIAACAFTRLTERKPRSRLAWWSRHLCIRRRLAKLVQPALQAETIELVERQADEHAYAVKQRPARFRKRLAPVLVAARGRRRIGDAPMRGHGLPRPHGADFAGCVVAHGEHEVESRRIGGRKLIPILA